MCVEEAKIAEFCLGVFGGGKTFIKVASKDDAVDVGEGVILTILEKRNVSTKIFYMGGPERGNRLIIGLVEVFLLAV